jgi:hypothetical protein
LQKPSSAKAEKRDLVKEAALVKEALRDLVKEAALVKEALRW